MLPKNAKLIAGYPNYYVTPTGKVWNSNTEKFRKPYKLPPDRLRVDLYKNNKRKGHYIHQLVLETFVGPCPKGMECCHNDGNARNNKLNNLRWDTHAGNMADRNAHGTSNTGERHGQSKLNELQVRIIRRLLELGGLFQREIAKIFNVSSETICDIKYRRSWKYL